MEQSLGKIIASIGIWIGAPILSLILMPLFTGVTGLFAVVFYFLLPNVAILASAVFIGGLDFLKSFAFMFKKSNFSPPEKTEHDKKYASSAMITSTIIYGFVGLLFGIFSDGGFLRMIGIFGLIGFIWGFIIYQLFQKNIFDPYENFIN